MGGRHEYELGLDKEENRKYELIGTVDGIKVLRPKGTHPPTPNYSNTPNTSYIVVSENNDLKGFYFYEGNFLVRSVDFDNGDPHAHNWEMVDSSKGKTPGRKSHSKKNFLSLTEYEQKLYDKVIRFLNKL